MTDIRSHEAHRRHAEQIPSVRCAVLTISDTRTEETDTSGQLIRASLEAAGHHVTRYRIVRDEIWQVRAIFVAWATDEEVDAIITTGSTGVSPRDIAAEALLPLLDKRLDGFGASAKVVWTRAAEVCRPRGFARQQGSGRCHHRYG